MNKKILSVATLAVTAVVAGYVLLGGVSLASIPQGDPLYYSGTLLDGGDPVDGERNIDVLVFDNGAGTGTPLCTTAAGATPIVHGRFRIALDNACLQAVRAHGDLWAQVRVDGESLGVSKLGAVPYSVEAERAESAPGVVGLGSIVAHMPQLSGAASITEMQAQGFAVCDGTTPADQGISGAVLAGATPDLNGPGLFLRGGDPASAGDVQPDATAKNGLTATVNDPGHNHTQNPHNHLQNPHKHGNQAHDHASRVSDSTGYCNSNNSGVPKLGHTADWAYASSSSQGCGYWTSAAVINIYSTTASNKPATATNNPSTTGVTVSLSGDGETRPKNASVVWMMRVK